MTVQVVELAGHRFVIVPEKEFHELEERARHAASRQPAEAKHGKFAAVTPLKVPGIPASQLLIQDRR